MTSRLVKAVSAVSRYASFVREYRAFRDMAAKAADRRFASRWADRFPALRDRTAATEFDAHYVYHTAWAVRAVVGLAPARHVDISSTLFFCSTLSAFLPVEFHDYRPAGLTLDGLTCGKADLTALPFPDASIESLSCMHVIEHIGLGRYGDALNPVGDLAAAAELTRVVRPGGHLLMVVPIGVPRLCFNAHRIYSLDQLRSMFAGFEIVGSALVRDDRTFVVDPAPEEFDSQKFGCGCFLLRRLASR